MKIPAGLLLISLLVLIGGCGSQTGNGAAGGGSFKEGTLSTTNTQSSGRTTYNTQAGETDPSAVVLRIEGSPQTTFSGTCTIGTEQSVMSGQVPQRFTYNLNGQQLQCQIQKQDSNPGSLKVILTAGSHTRSVQQTNSNGGTISLAYSG